MAALSTQLTIPAYDSWITPADLEAISRAAASGWVSSMSPEVPAFEREFADYLGVPEAVACTSGTTALHLAMLAAGIGPGDEVIVPDLTFIATASMVAACGATPVFADVSPADWNLDPASVARLVTPRTRAVIAVHLYGNPADCSAIAAAAPNALLIEDAAEACGALRDGRKAGSFGTLGCFSFFANKIITTGEGGMVAAHSTALANRMRFLRGHAMDPAHRYFHPELGFNYRLSGLQAALGRSQLQRIDDILDRKRHIAHLYAERLAHLPGLTLHPAGPANALSIFWMVSVLLPTAALKQRVADHLRSCGIDTRPFFLPLSSLPPFASATDMALQNPISRDLSSRGLNLPSGPQLTEDQIDRICDAIAQACRG